ncbi:hypothetical protein CNR34_00122 [Pseudomonas phage nickie]|uniref:Uncharacterized protein n=1 Tax=Pseudomonas phage nickie TaxID=2048977 RepID=A0A2H4P7A7_9CAUD|nr:hypothetical protein FDJ16_gp043 [Pseudomonas phage nickie]ATW58055.1 hypothetical protein CNR34_00122 [Pseudomonas phage nickie]
MTTIHRVFLYSSDVGRLTHEDDFNTPEEAKACVEQWIDDRDWDEELERGMFRIDVRKNGHLKGNYGAYAHAYPILKKPVSVEGESIEAFNEKNRKYQTDIQVKSRQILGHVPYPTRECAELAIDRAVDELAQELDIRLYGRIQREQRAAGIHERFITDLTPFGFKVYRGDGPKFQYDESVTIEDLKNLKFPEPSTILSKRQGFDVKSGALRVTDPCYSLDTWCAGTTSNVMNGRWLAQVGQHREAMDKWTKERFEKEIAELENPEEQIRVKQLQEAIKNLDGLELEEAQKNLKGLIGFYESHALREFGRCWGNPDDWSGRVAFLHIRHESVANEPIDPLSFVPNDDFQVGVDSGQAGFFDLAPFELVAAQKEHKGDTPEHEAFYEACGENTLGSEMWGIVQGMGCVSSSGYGDGGYKLCERRNEAGELIEARIVYMLEGSEMFPGIGGDEEDEE